MVCGLLGGDTHMEDIFRASTVPLAVALIMGATVLQVTGDSWYAAMAVVGIMAATVIIVAIFCHVVVLLTVGAGMVGVVGVAALPLAALALWVAICTVMAFMTACILALVAGDMAHEMGVMKNRQLARLLAAPLCIGTLAGLLYGGYCWLHARLTLHEVRTRFGDIKLPHRTTAA